MADNRIHPDYPRPPLSRSSSTTSSTFVIDMPDQKEINKEQEQNKDSSQRRRRRTNSCCCCCCCKACAWMCSVVAIALFLLGLTALILYLLLRPQSPNFSVTDVRVRTFNVSTEPMVASNAKSGSVLYLTTDMAFTVQAENPNKKIGIYFDDLDTKLLYTGVEVAQGFIAAFYTGHGDTKVVDLQMTGSDVAIATSEGKSTLVNGGELTFQVDTLAKVRVKVGSWKSGESKVKVNCDVTISNPVLGNARLLSKTCNYQLKSFHLF